MDVQRVFDGYTAISTHIENGRQEVFTGGTALGTVISGGTMTVNGTASGTTVKSGGSMVVSRYGAFAEDTLVSSGGMMVIDTEASGIRIDGGNVTVNSRAKASGTVVGSGGSLFVHESGRLDDFDVREGGSISWGFGGSGSGTLYGSSYTIVASESYNYLLGGSLVGTWGWNFPREQKVSNGYRAISTTITNFASQVVSSGGTALFTDIVDGIQEVQIGGTAIHTVIHSRGYQKFWRPYGASAGGPWALASNTVIYGGRQHIEWGSAVDTIISGGTQTVGENGMALNTEIFAGVQIGGWCESTILHSGASQIVGGASNTIVSGGAVATVDYGTMRGITVHSGGYFYIKMGKLEDGVIHSGATVMFDGNWTDEVYENVVIPEGVTLGYGFWTQISGTSGGEEFSLATGRWSQELILRAGRTQVVSAGYRAMNTVLYDGGSQTVSSGGWAEGTLVSAGGYQKIIYGGTASGTMVTSEGVVSIYGEAEDISATSGATVMIYSGGSITGMDLEDGTIFGYDFSTVVNGSENRWKSENLHLSGAKQRVGVSQAAIGVWVYKSASQSVVYGGSAINTTVSGGVMELEDGGVASDTHIDANGRQIVYSKGIASNTIIHAGDQRIYSGGSGVDVKVFRGGNVVLSSGGSLISAAIHSGGSLNFAGELSQTVIHSGGSATGSGGILGGETLLAGQLNLSKSVNGNNGNLTWQLGADGNTGDCMLNGINFLSNISFSIIVSPDHGVAKYMLASDAGNFNKDIAFRLGDIQLGSLSVQSYQSRSGWKYSLNLDTENRLFLQISDIGAPIVGTGLKTDVNGYHVTISWDEATDNVGVAGYELRVNGKSYTMTSTSYSLDNLAIGKYAWSVRAFDAAGNYSVWTVDRYFTVADVTGPVLGGGLTAVVDGYSVEIGWGAAVDNVGVAGYELRVNGKSYTVTGTAYSLDNLAVGSYAWSLRAFDAAGNYSAWSAEKSFTVADVTAPVLNGKPVAAVDRDTVTIRWNAAADQVGVAGYELKVGDKVYTVVGTEYKLVLPNGVYSCQIRAVDGAGNFSSWSELTAWAVDKELPAEPVVAADTEPTRGPVVVYAAFAPDSVKNEYSLDGKNWLEYRSGVEVDSNQTVHFRSIDRAGNENRSIYEVTNIDTSAPEKPMIRLSNGAKTREIVTVTAVFAADSVKNEYSFDGVRFMKYEKGILLTGNRELYFRTTDALGNSESFNFSVSNILESSDDAPSQLVPSLKLNKYNNTLKWSKAAVSDKKVKIARYEIYCNGEYLTTKGTSYTLKNLELGDYTVSVRAVDSFGRYGEWSELSTFIVADVTAPTVKQVKVTMNGYQLNLTWKGEDKKGEIQSYEIRLDGKTVTTVTGKNAAASLQLTEANVGKHKVEIVAFDGVNYSKAAKTTVTVKDATPPERSDGLTIPVIAANYSAVLSWNPGVDNSGKIASYEILLDGKVYRSSKTTLKVNKLAVGEHTYQVRAIDKAKNFGEWSEAQSFTVSDITAPNKVSASAKVKENTLTLSWKTPKDNVGVAGYILRHGANLEHTETFGANEFAFEIDRLARGNYFFELTAFDAAGNYSNTKVQKAVIKTELPEASAAFNLSAMLSEEILFATPKLMDDSRNGWENGMLA